jgi:2-polyprenyl-6-hydroxyphenyl methylase/3-demethylubiquinone-9 3-methyltransferase
VTKAPTDIQVRLVRWSTLHAIVMFAATALILTGASLSALMLLAAISFATLVWTCRTHWTRSGRFGAANAVTALRLLGVLALPAVAAINPFAVVAFAVTLYALDGVDGWLARKLGLASEFGEYLDKETDAFFMLVLCVLVYAGGRFGAWILVPGLLRYGFVVFLMLAKPPAIKERRSARGAWMSFGMISALLVAFTPFPTFYRPYAMLMTLVLLYSFADSLLDLYREPRARDLPRLKTRPVDGADEVRAFFDALADEYRESHGDGGRLLRYRLSVIRRLLNGVGRACLVEIGCGNGLHLFPIAGEFRAAIGTDLSPRMIAAAETIRAGDPNGARIRLAADAAERLASVRDAVADAVLCVGAFEHMQDRAGVLKEVKRVLKPGGAFVCLSANGGYLWYTRLAPWLRLATRHLSSDRFVSGSEWRALLREAGLRPLTIGYWRFVPAGDMPRWAAVIMSGLDRLGGALGISALRGGCYAKAVKS